MACALLGAKGPVFTRVQREKLRGCEQSLLFTHFSAAALAAACIAEGRDGCDACRNMSLVCAKRCAEAARELRFAVEYGAAVSVRSAVVNARFAVEGCAAECERHEGTLSPSARLCVELCWRSLERCKAIEELLDAERRSSTLMNQGGEPFRHGVARDRQE